MCEILIRAEEIADPDSPEGRMRYRRGSPVVVMPDGHPWGLRERMPHFALVKIPMVPVERAEKFIQPEWDIMPTDPDGKHYHQWRRREWVLRWDDLPQAARNKFMNSGEIVINAHPAYDGPSDYTWDQVRGYFRNLRTGLDESGDL